MGVRDASKVVKKQYGDLPNVFEGWNANSAYFKGERGQVNIGLGQGKALDIFNNNIQGYKVIRQ